MKRENYSNEKFFFILYFETPGQNETTLSSHQIIFPRNDTMQRCPKCNYLKSTPNSKCFCTKWKYEWPKLEKKAPKPIPQISEKKKERIATNWSEFKLFQKRFLQLKKDKRNFCFLTWIEITEKHLEELWEMQSWCFPHILWKGKFPEFRYFLNNIWLIYTPEDHKTFDFTINILKEDIWLEKLIKTISEWNEVNLKPYL